MRGLSLAGVAAVALVLALPASARTFRTDLNRCDEPDSFATTCWDGAPSGDVPPLPTAGDTSFSNTDGLLAARFTTASFTLIAFDYAQFMLDNPVFFSTNTIAAPVAVVSHGLSRSDAGPSGSDWQGPPTDNPLLRINWFFDVALLTAFPTLFEDVQNINGTNYFGVQLIFNGAGFELNGLLPAGMAYSRSLTANGEEIWNGAQVPCDTFTNAGACVVPEPPTLALIGLGLLALTAGLHRRLRPTRRFA